MRRYIDANKLIERLRHNPDFLTAPKHSKDGIIDEIVYQPTADVVEVRHGYWRRDAHREEAYCSLCDGITPVDCEKQLFYESDYCPSCGAKMDGERRTKDAT